jgi:hypothetical protein
MIRIHAPCRRIVDGAFVVKFMAEKSVIRFLEM